METIGINKILLEILYALRSLNDNVKSLCETLLANQTNQLQQLPAEPDEWLLEHEVMEIFRASKRTMYNWRKNNAVRSEKFGRYVYYLKSEVYKKRDLELKKLP